MKISIQLLRLLPFLFLGLFFMGCEENFDEPPLEELPDITPNATIAEIKALNPVGNAPVQITEDLIISGIVSSSDEAGNIFKDLVFQEDGEGLRIRLDLDGLYNLYPVGSRVYIRCQGLYIGDFGGTPQLSGDEAGNRITPASRVSEVVLPGARDVGITPVVKDPGSLTEDDLNMLIRLENAEFDCGEINLTYATPGGGTSRNRTVIDCDDDETIVVRNSDFSDFAGAEIPNGNGSITGVFSVFNGTLQLTIRDLEDVNMEDLDARCNACGGTGGDPITIADVRSAFAGSTTTAPNGFVQGTVISDQDNGNITGRNLVIQDGTAGIVLRFADFHDFALNDEIRVDVSGLELSEFNGALQVNEIPLGNALVTGIGNVTPQVVTIGEVLSNFEDYESELITIEGATISGGSQYAGSRTVDDGTGNIELFTRNDATFANEAIPSGSVDITAIVGEFNDPQIQIRNLDDVTGGGGGSGGDDLLNETFDGVSVNDPLSLSGWLNYNEEGMEPWRGGSFSGDLFAAINPFMDGDNSTVAWLITPPVNITTTTSLTFETTIGFPEHEGLEVFVSTDFDGSNVEGATWTKLNPTIAKPSDISGGTFSDPIPSGEVDLTSYSGTAYIGFKYTGDSNTNTTTYQLDDVRIFED